MNVVKLIQPKLRNQKLFSINVSIIYNKTQKKISPNKNIFLNSTISKANSNSISSLVLATSKNFNTNPKNNYFHKKTPTSKQKISLKHYNVGQKMLIYRKNNENCHSLNPLKMNLPADLFSKSNNQYYLYNTYNNASSKNNSLSNKNNDNNKNRRNHNFIFNNLYINNSQDISNISKLSNSKKNNTYISNNSNIICINDSIIHNKTKDKTSNPLNTYIINNLNLSKQIYFNRIISQKKPKENKKIIKDNENKINKLIKQKEESGNIIKKQQKLIQKIIEDNQKLENKIKDVEDENNQISKKIATLKENQEQLILLVKIIKKAGVNIEELIDKWNDEVEKENINIGKESNDTRNIHDSFKELNNKVDTPSFIPINIENPLINKRVFKGIPKLDFSNINNYNKQSKQKEKFKNNSK